MLAISAWNFISSPPFELLMSFNEVDEIADSQRSVDVIVGDFRLEVFFDRRDQLEAIKPVVSEIGQNCASSETRTNVCSQILG
jgi:hypothetical protein